MRASKSLRLAFEADISADCVPVNGHVLCVCDVRGERALIDKRPRAFCPCLATPVVILLRSAAQWQRKGKAKRKLNARRPHKVETSHGWRSLYGPSARDARKRVELAGGSIHFAFRLGFGKRRLTRSRARRKGHEARREKRKSEESRRNEP